MASYDDSKDYLYENPKLNNQKFACVSILGPDTATNKYKKRLVKVRGVYKNRQRAFNRAMQLSKLSKDNKVDIGIIQVGIWTPMFEQKNVQDPIKELNRLMFETNVQFVKEKREFEERKNRVKNLSEDPSAGVSTGEVCMKTGMSREEADAELDCTSAADISEGVEDEDVGEGANADGADDTCPHLGDDPTIKGQLWCCMSFLTPFEGSVQGVHGFKLHGVFKSKAVADKYCKEMQELHTVVHIFTSPCCGKWVPWNPHLDSVESHEYAEKDLNEIFSKKDKKTTEKFKETTEQSGLLQDIEMEMSKDPMAFKNSTTTD